MRFTDFHSIFAPEPLIIYTGCLEKEEGFF
ncbi:hypothetical protein ICG_05318 [Bacillus cereus BAG1X1-3]|nr:hypothetical protein ICG_05318 [Bacillus cereus BAG1X1-3]